MYVEQAILEEKYKCYGHFYSIVLDHHKFPCRSVLEIINNSIDYLHPNDFLKHPPELIAIMMNPGASRPKGDDPQTDVPVESINNMEITLTPTIPDRTQFQIMRLMEAKNWTHSRILNLSDLRDPESGRFYGYFETVQSILGGDYHTIFSNFRKKELFEKLKQPTLILAAWGVSDNLDPLIKKCVDRIKNENLIGVKKSGPNDRYYHPLLQGTPFNQKEWLEKCIKFF